MTLDEAQAHADRLNADGIWRDEWGYYIARGGPEGRFPGEWFVMRRPKKTDVRVAVFADGLVSISERECVL
jgi:hypothetical protein